jgi:poly(A) polymerase
VSSEESIENWAAPEFEAVLTALLAQREPIYVVGGAVRDALLGRKAGVTDLDLALAEPVLPVARRVADRLGWAYYPLDAERDVARIVLNRADAPPLVCDLAALRGELADDLALRDFTVNALALEMRPDRPPRLIDLWGGADDLRARLIRAVTPQSLTADPVRMLRAVRFAGQLDFAIEESTEGQIQPLAEQMTQASAERQRDELWKILALACPGDAVAELHRLGLLVHVLPEAAATDHIRQSPPHHLDVFSHTVQVMNYAAALRDWLTGQTDSLPDAELQSALSPWREKLATHFAEELSAGHSRAGWLVWHALFHDAGKPAAFSEETDETGARRIRFFGHEDVSATIAAERSDALRFSRREVQVAQAVAANHMRPHHLSDAFPDGAISRRACYRFLRATATGEKGDRTGLDVLLLALADRQAPGKARGGDWSEYLGGITTIIEFAFAPNTAVAGNTLVDGNTLMRSLDLAPGRMVGFLLESIAEAQAAGEVTSEDEALALATELIRKAGISPAVDVG